MSWLKRSEAAALPVEQPTTIHQHAQSYAPVVAVGFACLVLAAPLLWMALEFMLSYIDAKNAGRNTAILLLGLPMLYLLARCGGALIDKGGSLWKDINQANRDAEVKIAQYQLQASVTGAISERALDSDYALARGALAVLATAYKLRRPYGNNEARPWVRDNAWRIISAANISGLKWSDCSGIKGWLEDNNFIVGNQLNRKDFPEFEDARREVDSIAAPRLVINNRPTLQKETTSIIK